ncbi:Lipase 1, partial [Pseudolycoriella hygida]
MRTTNQTGLHYVGHSQGTTVVLAMLAMLPKYNENIITLHLICPIVFLKHSGVFFRTISAFADQIEGAVESMETGEMFPGVPALRKLLSFFCSKSSPSYQMCKEYMFATVGPSFQWNDDLFIDPKIFEHFPNSVSYKQLIHYGQIIKAGG